VLNFATGANKFRAGYNLQVINHLQITMHCFHSSLKQPNNTHRRKCHFIFATFPGRLFGVPKKTIGMFFAINTFHGAIYAHGIGGVGATHVPQIRCKI